MPRIPDFLVIGATKCGTESMHKYLSGHPDVYMHPRKELRYFSSEHRWSKGRNWYGNQFSNARPDQVAGESSNSYSRYPVYDHVAERIFSQAPNIRMIYLVRPPLQRIESHYRHRLVTGVEWRTPEEAIWDDPGYIAGSCYGNQVQQYLRFFDRQRILILKLEDLRANTRTSLSRLCSFLDIDPNVNSEFPKINVTGRRIVAPESLRRQAKDPAARKAVRQAVKTWRRENGRKQAQQIRAGEPQFQLSPETMKKLSDMFIADLELFSEKTSESCQEWINELSGNCKSS